jgi:catechol 2,3-dioxygenase-like lactoylglutathione lyase family enzyme
MSDEHGTQIGPVMIFSPKRAETVRFYRDIAGLTGEDGDPTDAAWLDAANAKLAVHDPTDRQTPNEVRAQTGFVVWFSVADVRAAFDRAKRAGCVVGDFYGDYFFARDPDGRYVGIFAQEGTHGHDHAH